VVGGGRAAVYSVVNSNDIVWWCNGVGARPCKLRAIVAAPTCSIVYAPNKKSIKT